MPILARSEYPDGGATQYWQYTRPAHYLAAPKNRAKLAHNVGWRSAKLDFLLHLVHQICIVHGRKTIVFAE